MLNNAVEKARLYKKPSRARWRVHGHPPNNFDNKVVVAAVAGDPLAVVFVGLSGAAVPVVVAAAVVDVVVAAGGGAGAAAVVAAIAVVVAVSAGVIAAFVAV